MEVQEMEFSTKYVRKTKYVAEPEIEYKERKGGDGEATWRKNWTYAQAHLHSFCGDGGACGLARRQLRRSLHLRLHRKDRRRHQQWP